MMKRLKRVVAMVSFFGLFLLILLFLLGGSTLQGNSIKSVNLSSAAEKNAWEIWSFFLEKGYSEEAAAGLLGNIDQETGGTFDADLDELGGGGGYGLIQWTPKNVLLSHMEAAGISENYRTITVQAAVIDWELSGEGRGYIPTKEYPYSGEDFKQLKDVKSAAGAYEKNRERPRDPHPERQELAQKWFLKFTGSEINQNNSVQNVEFISVALAELGNQGGKKFWSWYGYSYRVEWCAVFVSWCADQAGISLEKFAYCPTGVNNFKAIGKWKKAGTQPEAGDVIFFDWESDGVSDHVGLVTAVVGSTVHTVEGNSNDEVREQKYELHSSVISGYGQL